jgi:hypothetical protein
MARIGLMLDGQRKSEWRKPERPSAYVLASYDRERLYREVWAEPTQKVAERYGISDVALAKVCRQLQVPKPSRGYLLGPRRHQIDRFRDAQSCRL